MRLTPASAAACRARSDALVIDAAPAAADGPGAEADGAHLVAGLAQSSVLHGIPPVALRSHGPPSGPRSRRRTSGLAGCRTMRAAGHELPGRCHSWRRMHHGKLVIMALLCHAGEAVAGERVLARASAAWPSPWLDLVQAMPYPQLYPPDDPDYRPRPSTARTFRLISARQRPTRCMERLAGSDALLRVAQLRVLGGAMARIPVEATAFAHRGSRARSASPRSSRARTTDRCAGGSATIGCRSTKVDDGAYVDLMADEGDGPHAARPPPGRRGTGWLPSRLATTRPTSSGSTRTSRPPSAGDRGYRG